MKWFLVISGAILGSLSPVALANDLIISSIILGIYGVLALTIGTRRFRMGKKIRIKQSEVVAESNKGLSVKDVPPEGLDLPPITVEQEKVLAKENVGMEIGGNQKSGPVKMNHTHVQDEQMSATINPDVGSVTINPSVGTVKFIHKKQ